MLSFPIFKIKIKILTLVSLLFLFIFTLLNNSVDYKITLTEKNLIIKILGHSISTPIDRQNYIKIGFNAEERFSTSQYLILDTNFFLNFSQLSKRLMSQKENNQINFIQSINSTQNYIHFNPFRASLSIKGVNLTRRLEINIPDSSLEVWDESNKLNSFIIRPPWIKLILYPWGSSLILAVILAFSLYSIFPSDWLHKKSALVRGDQTKIDLNVSIIIFFFGVILIGFVFFRFFKFMPGFGDEMNYLIQAKIFASGKIFVNEPSYPEFFRVGWMDIFGMDGKLWNFHPPGNSLILMIGQILGIKWITVPLVGGLILLIQYTLAKKLFNSRSWAMVHVMIIMTSHYFLSLASSYMAHAPSLLFISLFYLYLVEFIKEKKQKFLLLSAASLGAAFLIRPLSAVLASVIPLTFILFSREIRRVHFKYFIGSLVIFSLIASFVFIYTYIINGTLAFPYLIKGPEVGKTLSTRLHTSWSERLTNLYRNANEFQNRIHSFGYILKAVFFFIPLLFIARDPKKKWLMAGYASFFFYLVSHSFLHWYGWKWEPRMIYDISFLFFLLASYGLSIIYKFIERQKLLKFFFVSITAIGFFYIISTNLPYRFNTEYQNYNNDFGYPLTGVRDAIKKKGISQAIVFFTNDKFLAPYTTENNLTFDGNIVYALSQNENYDYKLITKFPDKYIFYSSTGDVLELKPNFYQKDIYKLKKDLVQNYSDRNIITVIPWLKMTNNKLHNMLPGTRIDPEELINMLIKNEISDNTLVILVGRSRDLTAIISYFYKNKVNKQNNFSSQLTYITINSRNSELADKIPLFKMECSQWNNPNVNLAPYKFVTSVDLTDCFGENTSIQWSTYFDLDKAKKVRFFLESDDTSEIAIDDTIILQADQDGKHIAETDLESGTHFLKIKFYNGPGAEFLRIGTLDSSDKEKKLSIDSQNLYFYLPQSLWN